MEKAFENHFFEVLLSAGGRVKKNQDIQAMRTKFYIK